MQIGLNGSTTDPCTLEQDVKVAEQAGFDLLEMRTYKLEAFLKDHSLEDLGRLFKNSTARPDAVNAIEFFNLKQGNERQEVLEDTKKWCEIAQAAGSSYVVAVPSMLEEKTTKQVIIDDSVRMLREMSDIASQYGIKLAVEFIGGEDSSVNNLELANNIIEQVDRDNIGLAIDVFHFHKSGSPASVISKLNVENLFIVQFNDAPDESLSNLEDNMRLLPDEGVASLDEIGRELKNIGYDRMTSLELFREEYWEMDQQTVADFSYRRLKSTIDRVYS
ncbi:sugar phosphate isomerase/epimerase family protein [Salinicoccus sesuvii]|uniref:Sugar phosphate isomerase/epimerase family protein n=1 Tax=Salinicoccus sesuvii TaxID=868281 RepID=A0ABV7N3D3_9STAP